MFHIITQTPVYFEYMHIIKLYLPALFCVYHSAEMHPSWNVDKMTCSLRLSLFVLQWFNQFNHTLLNYNKLPNLYPINDSSILKRYRSSC